MAIKEIEGSLRRQAKSRIEHDGIAKEQDGILEKHGEILQEHEEILQDHGMILQEHDQRISVLESSSVLESKRLDNLCRQLSKFSQDIKEMLKSHEERISKHDLDAVKKEKDIDSLAKAVNGVLSVIRWCASTLLVLLAVFFIWYGMKQIIENKQLIAKDTVLFAQQVFQDCDGETRYHAAMEVLSTKLKRYGIKVSEEELDELIHTALKTAKKEFAGVWESIGKENTQKYS